MQKSKLFKQLGLICTLLFVLHSVAFAGGGNGGGSGSGDGGGDNPLTLESIESAHPLDALGFDDALVLNFSNNVVNLSVKENNQTCFTLVDENGTLVDFIAYFGDDQVDRSIRNTIALRPNETWDGGMTYQLTISENLMSKNGSSLGDGITLNFTVAPQGTYSEATSDEMLVTLYAAVENKDEPENAVEATTDETAVTETTTDESATDETTTDETTTDETTTDEAAADEVETVTEAMANNSINYGYMIAALIIIAGGYFVVKKNHKK